MEELGRRMNLKQHMAGKDISAEVCGPADIEVHKGLDGRFYVIDHARLFPPEAPSASRNHLFNLLRPEFVKSYKVPLSSDAFSRMTNNAPDSEPNNDDIRVATADMYNTVIPDFVRAFENYLGADDNAGDWGFFIYSNMSGNVFKKAQKTLIEELHRFGINIRHLGHVRQHATSNGLRKAILVEMIARVMKLHLRTRWRQQLEKFPTSEGSSARHAASKFLNLAFGISDKSLIYWTFELIPKLTDKFKNALTKLERSAMSRGEIERDLKRHILLRLSLMTGISFSAKFVEKLYEDEDWFDQEQPVPELHISSVEPIIKTTNTISYIEGLLMLHSNRRTDAKKNKTVSDQKWALKGASKLFKQAISVAPGGRIEILALSYVLYKRASMNTSMDKAIRHLDMAHHKLMYLKSSFPADPVGSLLHADVLHLTGILRNEISIIREAIALYLSLLESAKGEMQRSGTIAAHRWRDTIWQAYLQCGRCYMFVFFYFGRKQDDLEHAYTMAKSALAERPQSGECWFFLARTLSLRPSTFQDPVEYVFTYFHRP
jgi:hypothetical protein